MKPCQCSPPSEVNATDKSAPPASTEGGVFLSKSCSECGVVFYQTHHNQRYCSDDCRRSVKLRTDHIYARKRATRIPPPEEITCAKCKKTLPREKFFPAPTQPHGISRLCNDCTPIISKTEKKCLKCGKVLPIESFCKTRHTKHGRTSHCKDCSRASLQAWRKANPEKTKLQGQRWWTKRGKQQWNTSPEIRIANSQRKKIAYLLKKNGISKTVSSESLVGCSFKDLKMHLESMFACGMSWDNYGRGGWHVDHIIPCNMFVLENSEELEICFAWWNLQPMWEHENASKQSRFIG